MRRLAFLVLTAVVALPCAAAEKPNVLFIAVDDLRPALGCYGDRLAKTPNIDRFTATGLRFDRAYCQQAVCAPSRNALLTGVRPESLGIHDLGTYFRKKRPDAVTLPQLFKANGYATARFGKIFHTGHGNQDDPPSWTDAAAPGEAPKAKAAGAAKAYVKPDAAAQKLRPPAGAPDVGPDDLADGKTADAAIAELRRLKGGPFFLAVGFAKPHLPFVAPKTYWDRFDRAAFPLPAHREPPAAAPRDAFHGPGELLSYAVAKADLTDDKVRELTHAYYAATAYMDAQVGRVLAELDRAGLADKTIVVFWSDHGYQLGEHGEWAKHNCTELSTRIPLVVRAPGKTKPGTTTAALVESVDVYPSLCELAGLPAGPDLEGTSFVPVLGDPERAWKKAAFSVWPMRSRDGAARRQDTGLGRSMRTARYRFTEWGTPGAGELELYDHQTDPAEHVNLAAKPEHAGLVAELRGQLGGGWKAARDGLPTRPAGSP